MAMPDYQTVMLPLLRGVLTDRSVEAHVASKAPAVSAYGSTFS